MSENLPDDAFETGALQDEAASEEETLIVPEEATP